MFISNSINTKVIVPDKFQELYPLFIQFLEYYYEWLYSEDYTQNVDEVNSYELIYSGDDEYLKNMEIIRKKARENAGVQNVRLKDDFVMNKFRNKFDSNTENFMPSDGNQFIASDLSQQSVDEWSKVFGFFDMSKVFPREQLLCLIRDNQGMDGYDEYLADNKEFFLQHEYIDMSTVIKVMKMIYEIKGTNKSIELFFKLLFNIDVVLYNPKDNIATIDGYKPTIDTGVKIRDDYYHDEYTVVIKTKFKIDPIVEIFDTIFIKKFGVSGFRYILDTE